MYFKLPYVYLLAETIKLNIEDKIEMLKGFYSTVYDVKLEKTNARECSDHCPRSLMTHTLKIF